MASACASHLLPGIASLPSRLLRRALFSRPISLLPLRSLTKCGSHKSASFSTSSFTWDEVLRVSHPQYSDADDDSSYLAGFFDKIRLCNRGSEMQSDFLPLVVEDQIVGYVHHGFADYLRQFDDVFTVDRDSFDGGRFGKHVSLHPLLKTPEDRTEALARVVKCLGPELIPGIRNEVFPVVAIECGVHYNHPKQLYPVKSSFGGSIILSLERAAAPYFGIKAYGVHMNGYVEKDGQKYLWIGKRSQVKPTYPGMLDHLVAGGLPHDIACGENLIKECEEEAGIPRIISSGDAYLGFNDFLRHHYRAIPVGAVSYMDINGYSFKRDVLFCYDLKLPEAFMPNNQDGEVESFKLIPMAQVANVIRRTKFFKPNCALVITDFLFRHGYIKPEYVGYLDLLRSLKSGDCS